MTPRNLRSMLMVCALAGGLTAAGEPPSSVPHAGPNWGELLSKRGEAWSLMQCDFMRRRRDMPFLKENWGLDASGADLIRNHPALNSLAVQQRLHQEKLGIVDTGLRINGNPAAGNGLMTGSPEQDFQRHGTHVAGIAASRAHGVHEDIRVTAFPVEYNGGDENVINIGGGFDHQKLLEQAQKAAAKDSGVRVINLSISAEDDPAMQAIIREALENGKIVVYAAGNSGRVNDSGNAGLQELLRFPNLYVIGALNYLGTPASFSNYGPGTSYFVPGTAIESLSAKYNPNVTDSKQSVSFDGTSMAAPHFSAIARLLSAVMPELAGKDNRWSALRTAMNLASITRKGPPELKQPTAFKALELVHEARKLLTGGATDVEAALKQAAAQLTLNAALKLPGLTPPRNQDCDQWKRYLDDLKRVYFWTNGQFAGDLIQAALPAGTPAAERAYFAPAAGAVAATREAIEAVDSAHRGLRKERAHSLAYVKGDLNPITGDERKELAKTDPARYLSLLPATVGNLDRFLALCRRFLEDGKTMKRECESYIDDSPHAFRVALAEKLRGATVFSPDLGASIHARARNDDEKALGIALVNRAAATWRPLPGDDGSDLVFRRHWRSLTQENRARLLSLHTPEKGRALTSSQAGILALSPPDALRPHRDEVIKSLTPEEKDPLVGELALAVAQLRAGHGSARDVATSLRNLLGAAAKLGAKESRARFQEYGDHRFLTSALMAALTADESVAKELAGVLSTPADLVRLRELGSIGTLTKGILSKLTGEPATRFVSAVVDSLKSEPGAVYDFLHANKDHPAARAVLDRLRAGRQADAAMQGARLDYLADLAAQAKTVTPDVQAFLTETTARRQPILALRRELVAATPTLLAQFEKQLADAADPEDHLKFALGANGADFDRLAATVLPNLAKLIGRTSSSARIQALASAIVTRKGADARVMEQVWGQIETLFGNKAFMAQVSEDRASRADRMIELAQALARGHASQQILRGNTALARRIAETVVAGAKLYAEDGIPPPVAQQLRGMLPDPTTFKGENRPPRWVTELFSADPESADRGVEFAATLTDARSREEVEYSLMRLARTSPEVKARILAHPRCTPTLRRTIEENR